MAKNQFMRDLITASYPLEKAEEAILAASDKTRSMKVVLTGPAL